MGSTARGAGSSSCDSRSGENVVRLATGVGENSAGIKHTLNDLASHFDIFLTGHENQDISGRLADVDSQYLTDCTVNVIFTGRLGVKHLDRECSTRNGECRGITIER